MIELIILVDYENVQPAAEDLKDLAVGRHLLKVFHGPAQNSMPIKLATTLLPVGAAVEFIQCEKAGKDALDFHLAFHFGRLTVQHPQAEFVIVSRDRKGFAQLVEHGVRLGHKVTLTPSLIDEMMVEAPTASGSLAPAPATPAPARKAPTKKVAAKGVVAEELAAKKAPARKTAVKTVATKSTATRKVATKKAAAKKAIETTAPTARADVRAAKTVAAKKTRGQPPASAETQAAPIVASTALDTTEPAKADLQTPQPAKTLRQASTDADLRKALGSLSKLTADKRPGKATALLRHLQSHLRNDLSEAAVESLLKDLQVRGWVTPGAHGKVVYNLPDA